MIATLALVSCGGDDDTPDNPAEESSLVGNWYLTKSTTEYYTTIPELIEMGFNRVEVEEGQGEYWAFTASTVTVHDDQDLMDGQAVKYTYDKSAHKLTIGGALKYDVVTLTSDEMILELTTEDENYGQTVTLEFEKE